MHKLITKLYFSLLVLLSPALFANPATIIDVLDAQVRQPMVGRTVTAGYFTLQNKSADDLSLVSVSSDAFERIELHQHSHRNGVMRMEQVDAITVEAASSVTLKPGGLHLMLFEPKTDLVIGEVIILTLTFSNQQEFDIEVPIVALPKR
ncbi:copper chaperone PCu(A)C [Rheinheimera sp. WS51]|uniref:copper chaperone PCu(A)C n=1 Tax=Rheinheimera sp. WS51 TaxID=3425886 RepID=UPI003D9266D4